MTSEERPPIKIPNSMVPDINYVAGLTKAGKMRAWQLYRCTSHTPSQEKCSVKTHNCGTYSVCETTSAFPLVTKAVHTQRLLAPQISVDYALHSTRRKNYIFRPPKFQVDDFVLGGGVVELAVARQLALRHPAKTIYLVELHNRAGEEITGTRSIYYPNDTLKTRLCLRGRHFLYEHCDTRFVPHQKTGKLVVGHSHQPEYLQNLHNKSQRLPRPPAYGATVPDPSKIAAPTKLITGDETRSMEPDLSPDASLAPFSPETNIFDSHAFVESFKKDIGESYSGSVVYSTRIVRVGPTISRQGGWFRWSLRMASRMRCLRALLSIQPVSPVLSFSTHS